MNLVVVIVAALRVVPDYIAVAPERIIDIDIEGDAAGVQIDFMMKGKEGGAAIVVMGMDVLGNIRTVRRRSDVWGEKENGGVKA
jgi:hypothetical protein